jgi:uncharacterized protein YbjT (DUF2867 family)
MANPVATLPPASRSVVVAGASGLVGRCLVEQLCADPSVSVVHALVRRPLAETPPKLQVHVVDFTALPALPPVDEVYLALGTTIKIAGSQEAFRAVDFDANLAVARAAQAAGARRAGLVSAMGATASAGLFYSRVKGELEEALAALHFDVLVIAQPSMLRGDRAALGQPMRPAEVWVERVNRVIGPLLARRIRPVQAVDVAAALVRHVPRAPTISGRLVLSSASMQGASRTV